MRALLHILVAPLRWVFGFFGRYTTHILITAAVTASVVGIIVAGTRFQNSYLSDLAARRKAQSDRLRIPTPTRPPETSVLFPTVAESSVLSDSESYVPPADTDEPIVIPTAAPLPTAFPTFAPLPTSAPVPTSAPALRCNGTATEYYSQVYVSPRSTGVGSTVTVTVELRDCKNALASDDTLAVSQLSNDGTLKINGQSGSVNMKAVNGKATFTATSQTAGTVTLKIIDTNQNFPVTEPGFKNPYFTFTGAAATPTPAPTSAPAATATPTAAATPTPTAAVPSPTPTTAPSPSPTGT